MISYEALWATMEQRKVAKYQSIYNWGFSSNTIRRIARNKAISTFNLNDVCLISDCQVKDILKFTATEN